ncbi:MAG: peptidoglycan recognition protein [Thermorudis peleae]|nr:peptidoglycan recognition protein [Thermorudis peleae]
MTEFRFPHSSAAAITRISWSEREGFPSDGVYTSRVFSLPQPCNSIEVSWQATVPPGGALMVGVRTSADGTAWSEWVWLHPDTHITPLVPDGRVYAPPVLTGPVQAVQYCVRLQRGSDGEPVHLEAVHLTCVNTMSGELSYLDAPALIDGWIIPRAGWGADESLRFDKNGNEIWPPQYAPVQKVIVHHTATDNNPPDPAAVVRAIYAYHAVTLGWGDIGYNFLIDWQGHAYEGRYGGPNVIGAHTAGYNTGSMGVAVIGNFESVQPPQAALSALGRLIRTRVPKLDPAGVSDFHDLKNAPNIGGHRDYNQTDCPGDALYAQLPLLRGQLSGVGAPITLPPPQPVPAQAQLVKVTFTPTQVYSGTLLRIDAVVQNTGQITLSTQDPPPGYVYVEGQDFESAGFPKVQGAFRVGVDYDGNTGLPNPFRWGLPGPLAPGQQATVTGFIVLKTVKTWRLTASLVDEFVGYVQQGVFPQQITVLPPPTAPAQPSTDPDMVYVKETQHNVPKRFMDYWSAHGGLMRFGYPLTEPFFELSATDGNVYLTQYFERARFEYHPENAGTPFEVLLGLLGSERTKNRRAEPPFQPVSPPTDPNVDYFPQTRHTLRGVFRQYWWSQGGLMVFGYPISEEFEEVSKTDGKRYRVQYFERYRFEWHPELAGTPYEVLLGHLGREVLIDRGWLQPG